jgi:hypothetical protein
LALARKASLGLWLAVRRQRLRVLAASTRCVLLSLCSLAF